MTRAGSILIDTGPIVALLDSSDTTHKVCVECAKRIKSPLLTCWPVVTEAAWLLRSWPGAISQLLKSLDGRPFELASLGTDDIAAVAGILTRYQSLGVQLADASLLHLANREAIDTVSTLDRRYFSAMRAARGRKLRLIP